MPFVGALRAAWYKHDENAALAKAAVEEFALQYAKDVRRLDPGIGGTKLWRMYVGEFSGLRPICRDHFLRILNENRMKVRPRVRKPKTTDSTHGLPVYPNLIKDLVPSAPN